MAEKEKKKEPDLVALRAKSGVAATATESALARLDRANTAEASSFLDNLGSKRSILQGILAGGALIAGEGALAGMLAHNTVAGAIEDTEISKQKIKLGQDAAFQQFLEAQQNQEAANRQLLMSNPVLYAKGMGTNENINRATGLSGAGGMVQPVTGGMVPGGVGPGVIPENVNGALGSAMTTPGANAPMDWLGSIAYMEQRELNEKKAAELIRLVESGQIEDIETEIEMLKEANTLRGFTPLTDEQYRQWATREATVETLIASFGSATSTSAIAVMHKIFDGADVSDPDTLNGLANMLRGAVPTIGAGTTNAEKDALLARLNGKAHGYRAVQAELGNVIRMEEARLNGLTPEEFGQYQALMGIKDEDLATNTFDIYVPREQQKYLQELASKLVISIMGVDVAENPNQTADISARRTKLYQDILGMLYSGAELEGRNAVRGGAAVQTSNLFTATYYLVSGGKDYNSLNPGEKEAIDAGIFDKVSQAREAVTLRLKDTPHTAGDFENAVLAEIRGMVGNTEMTDADGNVIDPTVGNTGVDVLPTEEFDKDLQAVLGQPFSDDPKVAKIQRKVAKERMEEMQTAAKKERELSRWNAARGQKERDIAGNVGVSDTQWMSNVLNRENPEADIKARLLHLSTGKGFKTIDEKYNTLVKKAVEKGLTPGSDEYFQGIMDIARKSNYIQDKNTVPTKAEIEELSPEQFDFELVSSEQVYNLAKKASEAAIETERALRAEVENLAVVLGEYKDDRAASAEAKQRRAELEKQAKEAEKKAQQAAKAVRDSISDAKVAEARYKEFKAYEAIDRKQALRDAAKR